MTSMHNPDWPIGQEIESVIAKGGDVSSSPGRPRGRSQRKINKVLLRMPVELRARVDEAVDARTLPITRHSWLLEAVLEKLERAEN